MPLQKQSQFPGQRSLTLLSTDWRAGTGACPYGLCAGVLRQVQCRREFRFCALIWGAGVHIYTKAEADISTPVNSSRFGK